MQRSLLVGAIILGTVVTAAVISFRRDDGRDAEASVTMPAETQGKSEPAVKIDVANESAEELPTSEARDGAAVAHVEHKYRYLLADVAGPHADDLKQRLLDFEIEEDPARKAAAEARVIEMLSPDERDYYLALKDSDVEQHQVTAYAGGVSNIAPLDTRQERQILDAKLRQKQRYAATLRDAGLDRDSLSPAEREYAHAQVAGALRGYLDDFLVEVSASLTPEQYTLLKNYETTEYQHELERLQRQINAK